MDRDETVALCVCHWQLSIALLNHFFYEWVMSKWLAQKVWEWIEQRWYRVLLKVEGAVPNWIPFATAYRQEIQKRKASFIACDYRKVVQRALDETATVTPADGSAVVWDLADRLKRLYAVLAQDDLAVPQHRHDLISDPTLWLSLQRSYLSFVLYAADSWAPWSLEEFRQAVEAREKEYMVKPIMKAIEADLKKWGDLSK